MQIVTLNPKNFVFNQQIFKYRNGGTINFP